MNSISISKSSSKNFGSTPVNTGKNVLNFKNSISQKSITTNPQINNNNNIMI